MTRRSDAGSPSPADPRFTFGLWTVGNPGRDPFGEPTRPPRDPVQTRCTGWPTPARGGSASTTTTSCPTAPRQRARPDRRAVQGGACEERGLGVGMATTNLFAHPAFKDGAFTSNDRARAARGDRQGDAVDRPRCRAGRGGLRLLGRARGHRGRRRQGPAGRAGALPRGDQHARRLRRSSRATALRFAIEPKPNEPRGDMFLPTVGPRAALHLDARPAGDGRRQPGDGPRDDGRDSRSCTASARRCGRASCSTSTSTPSGSAATTRTIRFGAEDLKEAFHLVRLLERAGYDGPRHFDAHPYRNEDEEGVWEFARGCMRTYTALAERARHFDSLPGGPGGAGGRLDAGAGAGIVLRAWARATR